MEGLLLLIKLKAWLRQYSCHRKRLADINEQDRANYWDRAFLGAMLGIGGFLSKRKNEQPIIGLTRNEPSK